MAENSLGYLLVASRTADGILLLPGAHVRVLDSDGELLYDGFTNRDGYTDEIEVVTPPKENSLIYGQANPYATVSVLVEKEGFYDKLYETVEVFPSVVTVQSANLQPSIESATFSTVWEGTVQYG